jgi:membrane-bound inhibitor of C-type lysozyme
MLIHGGDEPGEMVGRRAEGRQLAVRYAGEGQRQAMVILPEREFRLDQVQSATGMRYTNGRTTLLSKGDEVELEEGGSLLYAGCKRAA